MLKATTYKSSTTALLGLVLATLFALICVPTANAQGPFDLVGSNVSDEQKEQIKQRLQDAQMRIIELREKNKTSIGSSSTQQKEQIKETWFKNKEQMEELRKKAEERIKELREKASLKTDDDEDDSLESDRGNAISDVAKQMRSSERSALFGAIIERLQKIDAERGDGNPILKAAIEQLQKLRSQVEADDDGDEDEVEDEDEDEDDN